KTVSFAGEHGLLLAVRGGGHNVAGFGTCEGGIVLDLSAMRGVKVDAAGRTAQVQGGARWRDFDGAAQEFGLATTGGAISTTGVGGLTLGGGIGWLMRSHGLASDNLRSAELIGSDGKLLTASTSENPDLFWGLRGGGGNFGVVTSFDFDLHPVGTLLAGKLIHPAARAPEALRFYREITAKASDRLALFFGFMTSPEGMPVVAFAVAYN